MMKTLPLCVLLVAHAFTASAFSLLGAGSKPVPVSSSPEGLSGLIPNALAGGSPDTLSGVSPDGASGLLNIFSSDGGILGLGTSPLDPNDGDLLAAPADVLFPVLENVAGNPLFELAPFVDLSDSGLEEVLINPAGLADLTSQLTSVLLGVFDNLTNVVVPDELVHGPAPDVEARRFGLTSETHRLTTPDGYILTVFRFRSACTIPGRVVILTSTFLTNSANFILLQQESLAYKLAWQCNDVWIVPFRGTRWAAENTKLSYYSNDFWNSTILEYGIYDLRVGIEFVSECTGSTSIRLITSDLGASALVAMNSKLGDDSPQCKLGHAYIIEPFICMQHTKSVVFAALKLLRDALRIVSSTVADGKVPLGEDPYHRLMYLLCGIGSAKTCIFIQKLFFGISDSIDPNSFPYAYKYILESIQTAVAANILQTTRSDRCLCEFDYGKPRNLVLYNSERPPAYNIAATTVPVSLFCNEKSNLVPNEDCTKTYESFCPSARRRFSVIKDGTVITTFIPKNPDAFLYDKLLADMEEDYRDDCIAACTKPCRSCR